MAEPKTYTAAEQAAAEVMLRHYRSEFTADHLTWRDFADDAREILAAAGQHIRREAAEEIAVLIWDPKTDPDALKAERDTWWRGLRHGRRDAAQIALEHCPAPDHTTTDQGDRS